MADLSVYRVDRKLLEYAHALLATIEGAGVALRAAADDPDGRDAGRFTRAALGGLSATARAELLLCQRAAERLLELRRLAFVDDDAIVLPQRRAPLRPVRAPRRRGGGK